jgi:hypothetical protein
LTTRSRWLRTQGASLVPMAIPGTENDAPCAPTRVYYRIKVLRARRRRFMVAEESSPHWGNRGGPPLGTGNES